MSTRIPERVYSWLINAQYVLLPGTCIQCHKPSYQQHDLCDGCLRQWSLVNNPCRECGLPLPAANYSGMRCGTCMVFSPPFSRTVIPFQYQPPVSALIAGFKYAQKLANGRVLGEQLACHLAQQYQHEALPSVLIPVPLHNARIRHRGFNQALEIARILSRHLDISIRRDIVSRVSNTAQQTGLSAKARKRNLRSAFSVNHDFHFAAGTTVAVVDDVVTTGVTVSELARVLLKAGAKAVHIWAIARTVT